MKLAKTRMGFLVLISVFLVGFLMTGHSEAAKKKRRFKFTRITDVAYSDQWNNFQAMISGDGKKVLYLEKNSGGLYLVNSDGTDAQLIVNGGQPWSINYDGSIVFYSLVGEEGSEYYVWYSTGATSRIKPCISSPLIDTDKCLERIGDITFSGNGYYSFFETSSPWNCAPAQGPYGNWYWYCENTSEGRIYRAPTDYPTDGESVDLFLDIDKISLPDHDTRFDPSIVKLSANKEGNTLAVLISYMPEGGKSGNDRVAMLYFIKYMFDLGGAYITNKIYIDNATYQSSASRSFIYISPDAEWVIYEKRSVIDQQTMKLPYPKLMEVSNINSNCHDIVIW